VIRSFVKEQGIKNFFDINHGICHQVLPENGFASPGKLLLGSDSHTTTYGAFGAFSAGIGRTEAAAIWATGELWLMVPESFRVDLSGEFKSGVYAKDLILSIIGDIGADGALYKSVEINKQGKPLTISQRMTIANMAAEMGAKNCYLPPDKLCRDWLKKETSVSDKEYKNEILPDPGASYEKVLNYNLGLIEPVVAAPHSVDNVVPISELKGKRVHQALLGTCTNGRLDDLEVAAKILKGKKLSSKCRLLVFPASGKVYMDAIDKGYIKTLIEAGAVVMNPGCGPCLGAHEGALAQGEVCISSANRNFKGRMGCKEAFIYLASPAGVVASALKGEIADPREFVS
jgi:homoaconitate hydratase family protein